MSKSKGKIPRINLLAVRPLELSSENWGSLEAIYGYSIPFDTRERILRATNEFLKWAFAENTGSMKDAIQRAYRLRKQARALVATIENRPIGDVTREYVDDELALSHDRLNDGKLSRLLKIRTVPLASRQYVRELSEDLVRFVNSCDVTLEELAAASAYDYWPTGGAWKTWIQKLTALLENKKLPTSARKDTDKRRSSERGSPFVEFVGALHECLPPKCRRARHSKSSLANEIHKARRGLRPPVSRRKLRVRKAGLITNNSPT